MNRPWAAELFADYGLNLRFEDIPPLVVDRAKERILDTIGVSLLGAKMPCSNAVYHSMSAQGGNPQAIILGYGGKTSVTNAAFINGTFSHANDYDDYGAAGPLHPSAPAVWTALPLAEFMGSDGKSIITSVVCGVELSWRVAEAGWSGPSQERAFGKRGFQASAVCCTLGSAAQAGVLLGLSREQIVSAIGIAGSFPGGLLEFLRDHTDTKRFLLGKAAQQGIVSALLAKHGFVGPRSVIEGEKGFLNAYSDGHVREKLWENLGKTFYIQHSNIKKWPTTGGNTGAIESFEKIMNANHLDPRRIKSIGVEMRTQFAPYSEPQVPTSRFAAEMSLPFAFGALAVRGKLDFEMFDNYKDPEILEFARKVFVVASPAADKASRHEAWTKSSVTVKIEDGREFRSEDAAREDQESRSSWHSTSAKFIDNCRLSIGEAQGKKLFSILRALEHYDAESLKELYSIMGSRFLDPSVADS